MDRVSSKMSLIAAQISSVETSTTSSTQVRAIRNGSAPICFTATPSAKIPTCSRTTRSPAASAAWSVGVSSGSTPTMRVCGHSVLM